MYGSSKNEETVLNGNIHVGGSKNVAGFQVVTGSAFRKCLFSGCSVFEEAVNMLQHTLN